MAPEPRRPWRIARRVAGGMLGLVVEALVLGLSIVAALATAVLVLWVA